MNLKELIQRDFTTTTYSHKPYVTYGIILINVLVFILMTAFGADFLYPSSESLIVWGANFGIRTYDGEQWRLVTSTFLHVGIFHIAMNMYVLYSIGLILEGVFGSYMFFVVYMLCGIGGSLGSLFWDSFVVSAGASGAIFGLFGWFFALLSTNFFDKAYKEFYFKRIAFLLILNLGFGFATGWVDNAAHIGGLFTGFSIGYIIYYSLSIKKVTNLKLFITVTLIVIYGAGFYYFYTKLNKDILVYNTTVEKYKSMEGEIIATITDIRGFEKEEKVKSLQYAIEQLDSSIVLMETLKRKKLPENLLEYAAHCYKSSTLMKENYTFYKMGIEQETNAYDSDVLRLNNSLDSLSKTYDKNY
jgi:rhomboid protease GluP